MSEASALTPESLSVPPTSEPYRTTEAEQRAIIAERLAGVQVKEIAKRYGISEVTVWRICKPLKDAADAVAKSWRQEQTDLAIESVNRALVDVTDTYKSGTIGVQVLKGLGVYAADQNVSVVTLVSSAPTGFESIVGALPTTSGSLPVSDYVDTATIEVSAVDSTSDK